MKHVSVATSDPVPAPLYARLMGTAWAEVPEAVRQVHLDGRLMCGIGSFRIRHGTNQLARFLLSILRLPPAAEAVATKLVITPLGCGERWMRRFGDKELVTTQAERTGGVLVERVSIVELWFQLQVSDRALIYRQLGAALRLGPLSVPLPQWLWPRVEAREETDVLNRVRVSVIVTVPLAGVLISYDGHIHREEPE
jgi:hypothetical protein